MGNLVKGIVIGGIVGVGAMVALYPAPAQRRARKLMRSGKRAIRHYSHKMGM